MSTAFKVVRVPEDRLHAFIRKAYDLSWPAGMGHLQYVPGPLPLDELQRILKPVSNPLLGITMDYVLGRGVKLCIHRDGEGFFIEDTGRWFDHSDLAWGQLLEVLL